MNSKYFVETSFILFLNKRDLFKTKIQKTPIESCGDMFADCTAGSDYDMGVEYMKRKFLDRNRNHSKDVYVHVTCDGHEQCRGRFQRMQDIILKKFERCRFVVELCVRIFLYF